MRTLKRAAVRWEVKNFERIAGKSCVTQTMTRDGLVMENQATGTVENVSTREAERDYSTDAEGKAEKILERAEDIKDGAKIKRKRKRQRETAATAESEDGLHGSAARLEPDRGRTADPALAVPYIQKAGAKKADKLEVARAALPKSASRSRKSLRCRQRQGKSTLCFEQQDKGPPSLKPTRSAAHCRKHWLPAHGKIHEVEHENVGGGWPQG